MRPLIPTRRSFVQSLGTGSLLSLADNLALAGSALPKASFPLIVPRRSPGSIFLSPEASPSEKWAAEQLSFWLERMTGAQLPISVTPNPPASLHGIAVGRSAVTDRRGAEIPEGEACLLKTSGDTLILAGGRRRGTMYGVFAFLETLGCRWYTADIARIPQARRLWLPPMDEVTRPAFDYREVAFTEAQGKEWAARNRLNGSSHHLDDVGGAISYFPFVHSFYQIAPPGEFFGPHPEYFALIAGRRRGQNAQLCLTNPELVPLAAARLEEWVRAHPEASIFSVSQNDGGGWCECDPCQQVVREEGGAVSGLLLRFVNNVAERFGALHPGKWIDTLAYQASADPPAKTRPAANVQIRFCPIDACEAHPFGACVWNRRFRDRLVEWGRIAPRLYIWHYCTNFAHYPAPFPCERQLSSSLSGFKRAGVSGLFLQGNTAEGGSGEGDLRSYLCARLLWNPDIDANAEIRGFFKAVYGPASGLMEQYFNLRHREIEQGDHLWIFEDVDAPYLTARFLNDARNLLLRARRKTATATAATRIDRQLFSLTYIDTMRSRRCHIQGESYGPDDPARVRTATQALAEQAKKLSITQLRESYPLLQQTWDLDALTNKYTALSLTDDTTRLHVVPELGARIVSLSRAREDTNLLRVPDPGEFAYPMVGGLYFNLSPSYMDNPQPVTWKAGTLNGNVILLSGRSDPDFDLELEIRLDAGKLALRAVVTNRGSKPLSAVLHCHAEFAFGPSRKASLRYTGASGPERVRAIEPGDSPSDGTISLLGPELPREELTLTCPDSPLRIRNTFRTGEVARSIVRWTFRAAPQMNVSLWSPESDLAPGAALRLTSEYSWV